MWQLTHDCAKHRPRLLIMNKSVVDAFIVKTKSLDLHAYAQKPVNLSDWLHALCVMIHT
jgi:hypothetical protein